MFPHIDENVKPKIDVKSFANHKWIALVKKSNIPDKVVGLLAESLHLGMANGSNITCGLGSRSRSNIQPIDIEWNIKLDQVPKGDFPYIIFLNFKMFGEIWHIKMIFGCGFFCQECCLKAFRPEFVLVNCLLCKVFTYPVCFETCVHCFVQRVIERICMSSRNTCGLDRQAHLIQGWALEKIFTGEAILSTSLTILTFCCC